MAKKLTSIQQNYVNIICKKYKMTEKEKVNFIRNIKKTKLDKLIIEDSFILSSCFVFTRTKEGHDYWWDMYKNRI